MNFPQNQGDLHLCTLYCACWLGATSKQHSQQFESGAQQCIHCEELCNKSEPSLEYEHPRSIICIHHYDAICCSSEVSCCSGEKMHPGSIPNKHGKHLGLHRIFDVY
eukprot:896957_1